MVILVSNNRGGCGKSVTALNLAHALADKRKSTLLIDCDPQANLSIGTKTYEPKATVYDLLFGGQKVEMALLRIKKNSYFIPRTADAVMVELSRDIRKKVNQEPLIEQFKNYDYVIIDSAPSLAWWLAFAIKISDFMLIPTLADVNSFKGLINMLKYVAVLNPKLQENYKIFFNISDSRTIYARHIINSFKEHFQSNLLKTSVRRNIDIATAFRLGQSVKEFRSESNGAKDYHKLVNELYNIIK